MKIHPYLNFTNPNIIKAKIFHPFNSHLSVNHNASIKIGDYYQGGLVFYVDHTGKYGLIAAPEDQSNQIQWYNGTYVSIRADSFGMGLSNTKKIILKSGKGYYAASACQDLTIGDYNDWYLPSKNELQLMHQTIGHGASNELTNIGNFADAWYWSSTEGGLYLAWNQCFGKKGVEGNFGSKFYMGYVRAIRAF